MSVELDPLLVLALNVPSEATLNIAHGGLA